MKTITITNNKVITNNGRTVKIYGGPGSGFRGHAGRPGVVGGSGAGGGAGSEINILQYDNQGKTGVVVGKSVSTLNHKRVKQALEEIKTAGVEISSKQVLYFTQQAQPYNTNARFISGVQRFQKTLDGTKIVYLDPSINLGNKLSDANRTIKHEYGHFVDWYLGGRKEIRESGKLKSNYMSDNLFPKFGYKGEHRELAADLFVEYVNKKTSSGVKIPSLSKEQNKHLTDYFDQAMGSLKGK